nr:leucine-rich repeat domain-containing protein [Candidatus Sigynarchaeota archaeon]
MSPKKNMPSKKSSEAPAKGLTADKYFEVFMKTVPKVFDLFVPKWQIVSKAFTDEREKKRQSGKLLEEIANGLIEGELHALGASLQEFQAFDKSHEKEIDGFFDANPDIKKKFDDLQKEMNIKLEQFMNEEKNQEISEAEKATLALIESKIKASQQDLEESERTADPLKFEVKDGHVIALDLSELKLKEAPAEIGSLIYLQNLKLYTNKLSSLPDSMAHLTKLKTLALGNNELTNMLFDFGKLVSLEELQLDMNHHLSSLPAGITSLKSLQSLDLSGDFILPKTMSKLTSLRHLTLDGEPSYDQPRSYQSKLTTLASLASIASLTALEELKITFCEAESIPPYITSMTRLKTLDLCFSRLTSIPDAIGGLKSLDTLNLANNKLVSVDPIGKLPSLFSLFVNGNQLTTLPESFTKLNGLDYIDFNNNPIKSLPDSIMKWLEGIKERGGMVSGSI